MKIAMTHADLPNETRGGVAHQVHHLANRMVARGHDVTMFTFSPPPDDARYAVRTIEASRSFRDSKFRRLLLTSRYFGRQDYSGFDVVHFHGDNQFLRPGIPSVRTFYGSALDEGRSAKSFKRRVSQILVAYPLEWACAWWVDRRVGISRVTRRALPFLTDTIPCGVNLDEFRPATEKASEPTILFLGTLDGRKRGRLLLEVFERYLRPRVPEARLVMVSDQEVTGPGIHWVDRPDTEELSELYRRAWVFCLPSEYEGFGIPYVEAMASSTAVVATPNPGAEEILVGEAGLIVDDTRLGETLVRVLREPELRRDLEARGSQRVRDFSLESIATEYEERYRQAIEMFREDGSGSSLTQREEELR